MMLTQRNLGIAVFALAVALSGCKYFSTVVVPASDREAPVPVVGIWSAATQDYVLIRTGITPLEFETHDPEAAFVTVASGIDSGGVKEVKLQRTSHTFCSKGDISSVQTGTFFDQVTTQDGAVGSSVQNGLWSGQSIRGRELDTCPEGFTLTEATLSFTTQVKDFHNNTSSLGGTFTYKP